MLLLPCIDPVLFNGCKELRVTPENIPTLGETWHHATLERREPDQFHALRPPPPVLRGDALVPVVLAPRAAATHSSLQIAV